MLDLVFTITDVGDSQSILILFMVSRQPQSVAAAPLTSAVQEASFPCSVLPACLSSLLTVSPYTYLLGGAAPLNSVGLISSKHADEHLLEFPACPVTYLVSHMTNCLLTCPASCLHGWPFPCPATVLLTVMVGEVALLSNAPFLEGARRKQWNWLNSTASPGKPPPAPSQGSQCYSLQVSHGRGSSRGQNTWYSAAFPYKTWGCGWLLGGGGSESPRKPWALIVAPPHQPLMLALTQVLKPSLSIKTLSCIQFCLCSAYDDSSMIIPIVWFKWD